MCQKHLIKVLFHDFTKLLFASATVLNPAASCRWFDGCLIVRCVERLLVVVMYSGQSTLR